MPLRLREAEDPGRSSNENEVDGKKRRRRTLYGKEATLFALSVFYFVIATNTQTGWLFVLSAFLLGLLVVAWLFTRRTVEQLGLEIRWLSEPIKGSPARFLLELQNTGKRELSEVKLECEAPAWARETSVSTHAVTKLPPGERVTIVMRWTPVVRGEHRLPPIVVTCGAPFGLFSRRRSFDSKETFLIYPHLRRLPTRGWASLTVTALSEAVSNRGQGDSATLKGVRDYRAGDDLRQIHWKASAKRGPSSPLLVREHLAPAPTSSAFVLDTSTTSKSEEAFEAAVSLTASLLWSAHKEGANAKLWILANNEWTCRRHWTEQYVALARVRRDSELPYSSWSERSKTCPWVEMGHRTPPPILVKGAESDIQAWPNWVRSVFLAVRDDNALPDFPAGPAVTPVPPAPEELEGRLV